ncbi:zinc-binding metallopeptidase family protein [Curvivirga aplysinae]|uniref:amidohydrolase n=1 Tax=Curvivirga aplysinae TaxID=2529852 RepID=UPI0012BB99BA|nr:amidohydrolase [Curvivirga aplysinae]MTI11058.1 amidohydrolase [Curvivirga aplysinae]
MKNIKNEILAWVDDNASDLSNWHQTIFNYGETAWREYKSCAWYVNRLREEGFEVEEGSGGMPTAFCAIWGNGDGPTIGSYAEYDAVPGNCQAADTVQRARDNLSEHAGGHTDPHSALGISSLGGLLAAKKMMEQHNIPGTLKYFGEPAEKVRGSKPIHAANGYYDDLDAAISFHPFYMLPLSNTTRWNTHCGAAYAMIYTFECKEPEAWLSQSDEAASPIAASHTSARAPGANDALMQMYSTSKLLKESMVAAGTGWSMNECILTAGQATADNLPAQIAQIQYIMRVPDLEMAETVTRVLDQNAAAAAQISHCSWKKDWVCKSRPGLPNHVMAQLTYDNLEFVGAPKFNEGKAAVKKAQEIQRNLGLDEMDAPFMTECEELISPQDAERELRKQLPEWQKNFTSDDYTEYCWHAPTVRLYIARPTLKTPDNGKKYPAWVMNALGGIPETIDPMILCASKTIGNTIIDLLTKPEVLAKAKEEFEERTGGIGGENWIAPQCDYPSPHNFRWPEYIETERGLEWWIPKN